MYVYRAVELSNDGAMSRLNGKPAMTAYEDCQRSAATRRIPTLGGRIVKAEPEVPSHSTGLNRSNVLPLFLDEVLAGSPGSRGPVSADDG